MSSAQFATLLTVLVLMLLCVPHPPRYKPNEVEASLHYVLFIIVLASWVVWLYGAVR